MECINTECNILDSPYKRNYKHTFQ